MTPWRRLANRPNRSRASGQVLPLFVLFLIVLLGFTALAVDVSRAYADLRFYRATADAASLAGAQDLQVPNTRNVTTAEQTRARGHALESLEQRLGGSGASCDPTANIVSCALAGSPYVVSIKTPSPSCSTCDPQRSVQVTVRHPKYGLTFARVLGQNEWDVGTTSVAGLVYGSQYAIITLRPPKKLGATFDVKDITVEGGSVVRVQTGDVGSNSNMELNGLGSAMILDSGYKVFHFDDPPLWVGPPAEQKINTLIRDPNYTYPSFAGAPTFSDARTSQAGSVPAVQRASTNAACAAEAAKLDPTRYTFMASQPLAEVYCFNPGIYDSGNNRAQVVIGTGQVGLFKPGVYYLKKGLDVGGRIVGGYEPGQPGVALVFDECLNTCIFRGNNALTIALNAGNRFPPGAAGTAATAAIDFAGNPVQTSGSSSPSPPLLLTLLVKKDPGCFVPTSPPWQEPAGCDANKDKTLNIAGGGSLALEGVQYAPTDNVEISGGSSGTGRVGQIISWTLKYSGGTHINQHYPGGTGAGILRIDAACSAPGEPCNP